MGNLGPLLRSLPGEGLGRILHGFGEDFGRILEGFERPGEPEWRPKSMNFVDTSQPRHRRPPGQGLGGSWMDLGRILGGFCVDLGRFKEDLEWDLGRFLI